MPAPLDRWQERLERHFSDLAASRSGSGNPIFALEHGLNDSERQELTQLLHAHLAGQERLFPYWLLWAVYATEQGYGYDGHEYWVSFEQHTPRWRERGRAHYLRTYFSKFQKAYNGVTPSGPWAGWFKNISWPITHAILPRYLQLQFARALYDGRHQFARMQHPSAAEAGKLLAGNAWDASSRFQEFLEQEELAGRIVLALLGQGTVQGLGPLYPSTLERIVTDLANVRQAGEWLKEARRAVSDRIHGVDKSRQGFAAEGEYRTSQRPEAAAPSVRPTLLLRRSSSTSWSALIEVPSFDGVAKLSPELSRYLRSTRCKIAGTGDAMLPAGWVMYGPQRRVMKAWPNVGAPMIVFERQNPSLENILRGECRFPQGPVWVFHIGSDGLARQIAARSVRAGQRYVVLSKEPLSPTLIVSMSARVDCEGVEAMTLDMPDAVTPEQTSELNKLGIQVARNIRLWPAGLCIRNWDGEGHGEWLSTETPCFGIVHDHAIDEYYLRLDNSPEVMIEGNRAGHPTFVRLPQLAPGRHLLSVRARRVGIPLGSAALRDLDGRIELKVRDPAPWKPGTTAHSGLAIAIDPAIPSLDDFWEGNIRLSVLGPEGRDATCSIVLTGRNGETVLSESIGTFALPIQPSSWLQRLKRFTVEEARALKYLDATTGRFCIRAEELGQYTLALERDTKPVRWICRSGHHVMHVRLIDDTGQPNSAETQFFPLKWPSQPRAIDDSGGILDNIVEEPGGLYFATQGEWQDALVVSSSHGKMAIQDLLVHPELAGVDADLSKLLGVIELWHRARLAGPLAEPRREHIVKSLLERLYLALCGSRWSHAEEAFLRSAGSDESQQLERAVEGRITFAVVLRRDYAKISEGIATGTEWFAEVAGRYEICTEPGLCTFALRLASWPFGLGATYGSQATTFLDGLRHSPTLMRGARFVALLAAASDRHSGAYLPRWTW